MDDAATAAALDAGLISSADSAPGSDAPQPAPAVDPVAAWAQFPALFGQIVAPALPELRDVFTERACNDWGRAMVPLAEKYNWSPGAFMEWLGPWVGVAFATWPLAYPTVQAIRARRKPADAVPADKVPETPSNVVPMTAAPAGDPELRDPTQANRPPRPV